MNRSCLALLIVAGCHSAARDAALDAAAAFTRISGSRWQWLESECNDGALDLARFGFERALTLDVGQGALTLTFDTELATTGCTSTAVWIAKPSSDSTAWRFEPEAAVVLPAGTECGAVEREPAEGSLRLFGETLELVTQRSPWCRGFDARFVFRRVAAQGLSPSAVVMRYVAAFNRRNADAVAALFDEGASLVEPFTRTEDGNYKRHAGRPAVRAWYASALASTSWSALRLLAIESGSSTDRASDHVIARWEYMDANLAEPLHGRNLFVIAGGEIYEAEVQLVDDPKPKIEAALTAPAATHAAETAHAAHVEGAP